MKWIAVAAFAVAMPTVAGAHSWYPRECCHGEDCVPVTTIERVPGQPYQIWHTDKFGPVQVDDTVIKDRSRFSEDGRYHLCAVPSEKRGERTSPLAPQRPPPRDRWHVQCVFVPGVT
ncbi:MAG: hypothetical protein KJ587_18975 [Alphaproteobacteria bacterium]|nr:hypothetical protein [Alphaproteobacteria bacterium]